VDFLSGTTLHHPARFFVPKGERAPAKNVNQKPNEIFSCNKHFSNNNSVSKNSKKAQRLSQNSIGVRPNHAFAANF
jgi:hypothetical protein